jgi:hypothetical protein
VDSHLQSHLNLYGVLLISQAGGKFYLTFTLDLKYIPFTQSSLKEFVYVTSTSSTELYAQINEIDEPIKVTCAGVHSESQCEARSISLFYQTVRSVQTQPPLPNWKAGHVARELLANILHDSTNRTFRSVR